MRKVVIIYGLIAGTIVSILMLSSMSLWDSGVVNFDNGQWVGYTTMVIALSMIFFGIKTFRDKHAGGTITFWKGVQIGIYISIIASLMYAMAWEISFANMGRDFVAKMEEHYVTQAKLNGATPEELKKMSDFQEMYMNPLVRFPLTLMEIFPVGVVITFISAGLLRRKEFLPSGPTT